LAAGIRYFSYPLPTGNSCATRSIRVSRRIANGWQARLARTRFRRTRNYLARCHSAWPAAPPRCCLRYGPGDYNADQDLYVAECPAASAVLLSAARRRFYRC